MNKNKNIASLVLFILSGVSIFMALLFAGCFIFFGELFKGFLNDANAEFNESRDELSEAVGIIIDTDSKTVISFEVNGEEYELSYDVKNSKYSTGTRITVYYNANNPSFCMAPELLTDTYGFLSKVFTYVGIGLGSFFALIGLGLLIAGLIVKKHRKTEPSMA